MKPVNAEQLHADSLFHVVEGTKVKIGRGAHGDLMQICCSDGSTIILETRDADEYRIAPGSDDYMKPAPMERCEDPEKAFLWFSLRAGSSGLHSVRDVRDCADKTFRTRDGWFCPPSQQDAS